MSYPLALAPGDWKDFLETAPVCRVRSDRSTTTGGSSDISTTMGVECRPLPNATLTYPCTLHRTHLSSRAQPFIPGVARGGLHIARPSFPIPKFGAAPWLPAGSPPAHVQQGIPATNVQSITPPRDARINEMLQEHVFLSKSTLHSNYNYCAKLQVGVSQKQGVVDDDEPQICCKRGRSRTEDVISMQSRAAFASVRESSPIPSRTPSPMSFRHSQPQMAWSRPLNEDFNKSVPVKYTFIHYEDTSNLPVGPHFKTLKRCHSAPSIMMNLPFHVRSSLNVVWAHQNGTCKPCAYYFTKEDGCRRGDECPCCHLCPPGEIKKRKKARIKAIKAARRARKEQINSFHDQETDEGKSRDFESGGSSSS